MGDRRRRIRKAAARGETAEDHCAYGHEFTSENTSVLKSGERRCKTCKREAAARRRKARKAAT